MTKTQYFASPAHLTPIHRVHTYDHGAFVTVDVYAGKNSTNPAFSRTFAAGDTGAVALFAARSDAGLWVARTTEGYTELTGTAHPVPQN